MKMLWSKIKVAGPWIAATAIFAYLFNHYPPSQVWKSLTYVNLAPFLAFVLGYFLLIYLADAVVTRYVIGRFTRRVPLKDVLLARGVTYLIMVISYPASQAAFAYYFKRRFRIPIFEMLSTFLFIMLIDLWWIATLALAGAFYQHHVVAGVDLSRLVMVIVPALYAALVVWLAFWRRWPDSRFWRAITPAFVERQRSRKVFRLFAQASLRDYITVAAMRIPIHFTIIISMYVVIKTFGCNIPFTQVLCNTPLVFFIGTLPITPGGLGTTNAVMVELLKGHLTGALFATGAVTPAELLFSATLAWMFGNYLLKVLTGIALMGVVPRALFEPLSGASEERVEHESAHLGGNL